MVFDLDIMAVRNATGYTDNVDNVDNVAAKNYPNYPHYPVIHGATATPKPLPKFHIAQPWNALDREFQAHYWNCPTCKAGGRSRGPLCPQGQQLSAAVDQAFAAA